SDDGFTFDKNMDTCIKLMETASDMSQGDKVCSPHNARLLSTSAQSSHDIALRLMVTARKRPKYVWTGDPAWSWRS
ncbi:Hypothetical predicted protein, partial [Olea europaea subsp. europaea]